MKDVKLLLDATKYLSNFRGDTFVVKLGGEVFYDEKTMKSIVKDIATLSIFGINIAVVHGAGREISKRMKEFGMKPKFIDGLRYTDEKTMLFVIGALKMQNEKLVSIFAKEGKKAIGIFSGVFKAKEIKNLGLVGEIFDVNTEPLTSLMNIGYTPVIAPLGSSGEKTLNINADFAASSLAVSLNASKLILLTDVEGVYRNIEEKNSLIPFLTARDAQKLLNENIVRGGMVPKVESALKAVFGGVKSAHIIKAEEHSLLLEILTEEGRGTVITIEIFLL